jgi:hypothetical protein
VTARPAPIRHHSLLPWFLTACGVIAGPALLGAADAPVAVTVASVALGLTALVVGFALRQGRHHARAVVPASRRIRALGWSPR